MTAKRVLIISDSPSMTTGYGRISYELMKQLRTLGYDCLAGSFQYAGTPVTFDGFPIYECTNQQTMDRTIEDTKPDYMIHLRDNWVVTNRYYGNPGNPPYDLMPACQRAGTKCILYSPVQAKPLPKPLIDQVAPKCDYLLTMSDWGKWAYIERGFPANKIDYLYHGINPEIYKPLDKKESRAYFGYKEDEPLLGYVGLNIDYRKNLGMTILVLKEVLKEIPNAQLVLWTETNSSGAILEDWISSHGVNGHVYFPHRQGKVNGIPDDKMAMLFNSMDCYVHTSTAEGFGMPVLEARACGVPIVSTDDPVIREINGHFIEYAETAHYYPTLIGALENLVNPFDMAKKVIKVLKNPNRQDVSGMTDARTNWTWEQAGKKLDSVLNSLKKA